MKQVTLSTDGSCAGHANQHGGWAAILRFEGADVVELSGGHDAPTNANTMELLAVVKGLEAIKEPSEVLIRTDSQWVLHKAQRIAQLFPRRPEVNPHWDEFCALASLHAVSFQQVKSGGDPDNRRCHYLAYRFTRLRTPRFQSTNGELASHRPVYHAAPPKPEPKRVIWPVVDQPIPKRMVRTVPKTPRAIMAAPVLLPSFELPPVVIPSAGWAQSMIDTCDRHDRTHPSSEVDAQFIGWAKSTLRDLAAKRFALDKVTPL